jgi:hypothetical protein
MNEKVKVLRENLRVALSRQKSYIDNLKKELEFQVGDAVFLIWTPNRGSLKHLKGGKLNLRYIGPFQILEWIATATYRLDLPNGLTSIHDVFN